MFTPTKEAQREGESVLSPLGDTFDHGRCKVVPFPDAIRHWRGSEQFAIVIENLLTKEECQKWIAETEASGYTRALVNVGGGTERFIPEYRNSARCIVDDELRAQELWNRVKPFVPSSFSDIRAQPVEINERLRFLRYDPGEFFAAHCDGSFAYPGNHPKRGESSYLTFFLYLNDEFEDGTCRFFASDRKNAEYFDFPVKPGSAVVFEHYMYHSGEAVTKGRKYALRSDVMFKVQSH